MATLHAPDSLLASPVAGGNPTLVLLDQLNAYHHKPYELPQLAREMMDRLPSLQDTAPDNNPSWPAYEVGTTLMRKARDNAPMHMLMGDFLVSRLPSVAQNSPSAAHGLLRAVLDNELEHNAPSLVGVNNHGFVWQGGRLSPARGGVSGYTPTLIIYPAMSKQSTLVDDDGFKGPLKTFAICARKAYLRNPERAPHYKELFKNVQGDLRARDGLPTFRQAVQALK